MAYGTATATLVMGMFIGLSAYLPIYFETVYHLTASLSGLALITYMVGTVTGATLSSRVMANFVHYKRFSYAVLLVAIVLLLVLAFSPHGVSFTALEIILPFISMGLGSLLPITTVAVQNSVKAHQMGTATGTMNFFRSLGGALAVAGFGALLFIESHQGQWAEAFRPVFGAAAIALSLAFVLFMKMPEKPLRTEVPQD